MGISNEGIDMLVDLKKSRAFSGTALTFGVMAIQGTYEQVVGRFILQGVKPCALAAQEIFYDDLTHLGHSIHQSVLFKMLGFDDVQSLDISLSENPDHGVDLNYPIDGKFAQKYDLVYDGGTTEHVFNTKEALFNVVRLLKCGGHVIHHVPVYYYVDHGYHLFSPWLFIDFYRLNGFEIISTCYHVKSTSQHCGTGGKYFKIAVDDPAFLTSLSHTDVMFHFVAKKVAHNEPFKMPVQCLAPPRKTMRSEALESLRGKKVMIWGTGGNYAEGFRDMITADCPFDFRGFVDNDAAKAGKMLDGHPIFSPEILSQEHVDTLLIASAFRHEILEQLYGLRSLNPKVYAETVAIGLML